MRILYILTSLGVGGAEKQTIELAERMAARGHTVAFLVLTHVEEEWPLKLPVLRLNMSKNLAGVIRGLRFAHKFLAIFRADLLHSHTYPANIFARLLRLAVLNSPHELKPLLVNTIHNVFEGGWMRMFGYRLTSPLVNCVTAVSQAAATRYVRIRAVPPKKMQVLSNGIDVAAYVPDRTRRKQARKMMQAEQEFIWLAVGRIAPAKDYPNLLRAFAGLIKKLDSHLPRTQLWIAGEGELADLYSGDVDGSGLDVGVKQLGLRRDIADLMNAADGFVLSSAWEGMPLVIGEAMASGLPVAATCVGGVAEIVGDAGWIVPSHDSPALAEAMYSIMAMGDRARKELGQAARERIVIHFSMDSRADEWESLYIRLLGDRQS